MKEWKTRLSILLALQLFLAGGIWAWSNRQDSSQVTKDLLSLDTAAVDKIEIKMGDKTLTLSKGEEGWTLPDYHNLPADKKEVAGTLDALTSLTVGSPETTREESHQGLGLSETEPEGRIKLFNGDQVQTELLLGSAPTFKQRFVRLAGENDAYRAEWEGINLQTNGSAWLSKSLLASGSLNSFHHPGFQLSKEDNKWTAGATQIDQKAASGLVGKLERLKVLEAVDKAPEKATDIEVETAAGESYVYSLFQEGGRYFVKRNDRDTVFRIDNATGKALSEATLAELTAKSDDAKKE